MLLVRYLPVPKTSISRQDRTFLTPSNVFGAISALSAAGRPLHIHENRVLHFPKDELFKLVSDIESYPKFLPGVLNAQVLARAKPKTSRSKFESLPALARLKAGLLEPPKTLPVSLGADGLVYNFVSNVYCSPEQGVVEAVAGKERASKALTPAQLEENGYNDITTQDDGIKDSGPDIFEVCRTRWLLTALEKNKTEVDLRIEIDWKNPVLSAMTHAAAPTMAVKMIDAFQKRAMSELNSW